MAQVMGDKLADHAHDIVRHGKSMRRVAEGVGPLLTHP
jgi:hypothetical protein